MRMCSRYPSHELSLYPSRALNRRSAMPRLKLPVMAVGFVVLAGLGGALGSVARADIILHEYFRPDPIEDLELKATTGDGSMSAAIQTQSGAVSAPAVEESASAEGATYGGERSGAAPGGSERLDGDTTQPAAIDYTDPFTPEIMPFKREFALDTVTEDFALAVANGALGPVDVGGQAREEDDQFYADLRVQLAGGKPVRIPTVGPASRVLALRTNPPTAVEILHDDADNWLLKAERSGPVRVTMQLAIDRAVFGSQFDAVAWSRLARYVPNLPSEVRDSGRRVAEMIGITTGMSPRDALERLIAHFRGFAPSAERPGGTGPRLFEEIVLAQKGVCRHRSFGFVVTALAIGLPARFVRNEAHAWVEVHDATRWHRIDLGGAAGRVDADLGDRPPHVAPRDPYRWPPGSDSGAAMADRARDAQGAGFAHRPSTTSGAPPRFPGAPTPDSDLLADSEADGPAAEVVLEVGSGSALRGGYLPVAGRVSADGDPCPFLRVDFQLRPRAESGRTERIRLGTLFTDARGRYEHRVVVPYDVEVGDYDVVAVTPGGGGCGQGESK
jgi:hypothetical protein